MARDYAALIGSLLAHAEDPANTPAAQDAYRTKAEKLMREYRIAQEETLATDPGSAAPIVKRIELYRGWSVLSIRFYPGILLTIADHTECSAHVHSVWEKDGTRVLVADVAGYEGDIRYLEFLWTAAHLMFATRVDPRWNETLTEAENVFFMRQAGLGRKEIANAAWGKNAGEDAKNRSKIQRIYLAEVAKRGENATATGLGFNSKLYREGYAREFTATLRTRLWRARQAADAAGGAVTLAGREQRVQEALWTAFPNLRPTTTVAAPYVAPNAGCASCAKAKSGYCREHNWLKPREATQADRARWDRELYSPSARAGRASGRDAAGNVHIVRGSAETGKMNPAAQREIG